MKPSLVARDPLLRRRLPRAEQMAAEMAKGRPGRAAAEAELSGAPAQVFALASLVMVEQYGVESWTRAMRELARYG
jgi:hypothetical protein